VAAQQVTGPGQGVPGGLRAGDDQRHRLVPQLLAGHTGAGLVVAGRDHDRHQVAVVGPPGPVPVDDAGQHGAQPAVGGVEAAVGPGRHPGQGRDVGHDPLGQQLGEQHPQQALDLADGLGADVGGQQGPGQHGEGDRPHLLVEGQRAAVGPAVDAGHGDLAHGVQIAGDLGPVEGRLHEAALPAVIFAGRHHQPVADQPFGPAEVDALLQLPGLADQRLPDCPRVVQQVDRERPEPDADHVAVLAGPLKQPERVTPELQRVPEQPPAAGQHRHVPPGRHAHRGHYPHPIPEP
jgi:hypothetical protein